MSGKRDAKYFHPVRLHCNYLRELLTTHHANYGYGWSRVFMCERWRFTWNVLQKKRNVLHFNWIYLILFVLVLLSFFAWCLNRSENSRQLIVTLIYSSPLSRDDTCDFFFRSCGGVVGGGCCRCCYCAIITIHAKNKNNNRKFSCSHSCHSWAHFGNSSASASQAIFAGLVQAQIDRHRFDQKLKRISQCLPQIHLWYGFCEHRLHACMCACDSDCI